MATHLTPEIDVVVTKALAKSPDDRHQSAGELAVAFNAALQSVTPFQSFAATGGLASLTSLPMSAAPLALPAPTPPTNAIENHAPRSAQTGDASLPPSVQKKSAPWLWIGGGVLAGGGALLAIVIALVAVLAFGNGWLKADEAQNTAQTPSTAVAGAFTPTPTATATGATLTEPAETVVPAATPTAIIVAPTTTPTATSTGVSSTLTPPPASTATPTMIPAKALEPAAQRVGTVRFSGTNTRLDTITIQLSGIEPAPAGKQYKGWLMGDTGNMLNVGTLAPDANGNVDFVYMEDQGRNLAAIYATFRISLEPDLRDAPEISPEIVFEGAVDGGVVPFVREAILRASDTPLHSLLDGLETETTLGLDHATFARQGLASNNFAGGLNHAEHALNILVGSADERFGDRNGDGQAQNPGDGYGVLGYLNALQTTAIAAGQADPTSVELALHTGYLQATIQNAIQRTDGIVQLLERCFAQDSAESALTLIDQAIALYDELLFGFDANSNGTVEPVQGEGGISLVTQHTGYLANIEVYRVHAP